jgi:hypothetical protein
LSGKWYVKEGKYCSDFGYGENCYQIVREGNRFYYAHHYLGLCMSSKGFGQIRDKNKRGFQVPNTFL